MDEPSDEYVAELLKQDARDSSIKYSALGLEGLLSKKRDPNAPKPNTRFLRNVIRDTEVHNATLKAREAEESSTLLRDLHISRSSRSGRKESGDHRRSYREKRARENSSSDQPYPLSEDHEDPRPHRHRHRHRALDRSHRHAHGDSSKKRKYRSEGERSHHEVASTDQNGCATSRHSKRRRSEKDSRRYATASYLDSENSGACDAVADTRLRRSSSRKEHSRGGFGKSSREIHHSKRKDKRTSSTRQDPVARSSSPSTVSPGPSLPGDSGDDSDPVRRIVGIRKGHAAKSSSGGGNSKVHSRGRGATSERSGIDARFDPAYNPSNDTQQLQQDAAKLGGGGGGGNDDDDDWDLALEAVKDRQRWKEQGAARLRASGFSEAAIARWEKGGENTAEDVKWRKKGEGREWDRGKVVGADGTVSFKGWPS